MWSKEYIILMLEYNAEIISLEKSINHAKILVD